mgnify:FL=1
MNVWQQRFDLWSKYSALALGFSIPLSTALMSIFSILTAVLVMAGGNYHFKWSLVKRNPLVLASITLFALLVIGSFYSVGTWHESLRELKKYHQLLLVAFMLPVFVEEKWRKWGMVVFIFAMTVNLIAAPIRHFLLHVPGDAGFHDHIIISILMAFSAFVVLHMGLESRGARRWLLIGLFLLMSIYELFYNTGRTGYFVYAALVLLTFFQVLHWKGLLLAVLLVVMGMVGLYHFSPVFHQKIAQAVTNTEQYHHYTNKAQASEKNVSKIYTSAGLRLRWIHYGKVVWLANPVLGVGTGGFQAATEALFPNDNKKLYTDNSNTDILTIAAQLGTLGLMMLLLIYYFNVRISLQPAVCSVVGCYDVYRWII